MTLLNAEEKFPVTIEDEVRRSYLDYAMSVIIGRALPDVRDGLKPVHRRCLFGMWEQNNFHNRPYKKSARIVGDVLGKYHPHGESSVCVSIVRMCEGLPSAAMPADASAAGGRPPPPPAPPPPPPPRRGAGGAPGGKGDEHSPAQPFR